MGAPLDLVIAGVPKCGTSSLYYALRTHPEIQGTTPEETYYFSDAIMSSESRGRSFASDGWDGFEACFGGKRNGRRRLEATAINLFQKTALAQFAALSPQPLVLVSLRCPAEQIRSAFYFHRSYGRIAAAVDLETYVRALLEDDAAAIRNAVPDPDVRGTLGPSMRWNRYVEWLDRWAHHFPPERLFILTLRKFSDDPVTVLKCICMRLGIDPSQYSHDHPIAPHLNPTTAGRVAEPGLLWRIGRRVVPRGPVRERLAGVDRKRRMGAPLGAPSPADDEILELLGARFEPYNRDLAARYGVDISGWRPHAGDTSRNAEA